jgi:hypothetical protein
MYEIFLGGPDRMDGQLEIVIRKSEGHLSFLRRDGASAKQGTKTSCLKLNEEGKLAMCSRAWVSSRGPYRMRLHEGLPGRLEAI